MTKGIYYHKPSGKWRALNLGYFATEKAAIAALPKCKKVLDNTKKERIVSPEAQKKLQVEIRATRYELKQRQKAVRSANRWLLRTEKKLEKLYERSPDSRPA